jgi:hypothetical protein
MNAAHYHLDCVKCELIVTVCSESRLQAVWQMTGTQNFSAPWWVWQRDFRFRRWAILARAADNNEQNTTIERKQ